jgi:Polyketide cyclase / dehydrase and lipid transport
MSAVVAASRNAVWSALSEPAQVLRWRPGALAVLPPVPGELAPGRVLRLRCVVAAVPVVLEEQTLELLPEEKLRSELRVGLFRCEETFTLAAGDPDGGHTRVGVRITTPSETPLVGESLDRFGVRRFATELAAGSLAALRTWCELGHARAAAREAHPETRSREAV